VSTLPSFTLKEKHNTRTWKLYGCGTSWYNPECEHVVASVPCTWNSRDGLEPARDDLPSCQGRFVVGDLNHVQRNVVCILYQQVTLLTFFFHAHFHASWLLPTIQPDSVSRQWGRGSRLDPKVQTTQQHFPALNESQRLVSLFQPDA